MDPGWLATHRGSSGSSFHGSPIAVHRLLGNGRGRSSDLWASRELESSVDLLDAASQVLLKDPVLLAPFVPTHRCGTAPEWPGGSKASPDSLLSLPVVAGAASRHKILCAVGPVNTVVRPAGATLRTIASAPRPYTDHEVVFRNDRGPVNLAGTLSLPDGKGPFPAVLLIAAAAPEGQPGHRANSARSKNRSRPWRCK